MSNATVEIATEEIHIMELKTCDEIVIEGQVWFVEEVSTPNAYQAIKVKAERTTVIAGTEFSFTIEFEQFVLNDVTRVI